ncbi:hypothetical protein IAT38_002279 [Cryptococcus sp. DSM 104549]
MASSAFTYTLTPLSYSLPILHAAAHPSSTVLGVFLSSSPVSSTSISIEDALPLLHVYTALSPMMEAGLSLAEEYAKGKGMRVVGLYVAREDEGGLGRVGERVLGVLREKFAGSFGLSLDNDRLAAGQPAYIPYLSVSPSPNAQYQPVPSTSPETLPAPFILLGTSLPSATLKVIREHKVHRDLRDFDDHLEDSTQDWLENAVVKATLRKHLS